VTPSDRISSRDALLRGDRRRPRALSSSHLGTDRGVQRAVLAPPPTSTTRRVVRWDRLARSLPTPPGTSGCTACGRNPVGTTMFARDSMTRSPDAGRRTCSRIRGIDSRRPVPACAARRLRRLPARQQRTPRHPHRRVLRSHTTNSGVRMAAGRRRQRPASRRSLRRSFSGIARFSGQVAQPARARSSYAPLTRTGVSPD
jgi:hypothetical protein